MLLQSCVVSGSKEGTSIPQIPTHYLTFLDESSVVLRDGVCFLLLVIFFFFFFFAMYGLPESPHCSDPGLTCAPILPTSAQPLSLAGTGEG